MYIFLQHDSKFRKHLTPSSVYDCSILYRLVSCCNSTLRRLSGTHGLSQNAKSSIFFWTYIIKSSLECRSQHYSNVHKNIKNCFFCSNFVKIPMFCPSGSFPLLQHLWLHVQLTVIELQILGPWPYALHPCTCCISCRASLAS